MNKQEILDRIELRQSTIKDYLHCPKMFYFKHILGIKPSFRNQALIFGSVIHKMLELIHTGQWSLDVESEFDELAEYYENAEDVPVYWKSERDNEIRKYRAKAVEIMDNYRDKAYNQNVLILYSETKFRVKIGGDWFTGTLDQVRQNIDGTIELIDFKTSRRKRKRAFLENDIQLNLYSYALKYGELLVGNKWVKPNILVDYATWYHLRNHQIRKRTTKNGSKGEEKGYPLLRTEKSIDDLRNFREEIKTVVIAMTKDWYYKNNNSCVFCSYKEECLNEIPENIIKKAKRKGVLNNEQLEAITAG